MTETAGDTPPPNIVLFVTDQQQHQVTESDHPCRTPTLDAMAASGVRFRTAFAPAAHCCPSRATMMTGLYPSRHGIFNNVLNGSALRTTLDLSVPLFTDDLQRAGYRLYYSGKWHVDGERSPGDVGFEELEVTAVGGVDYHGTRWSEWERLATHGEGSGAAPARRRGELVRSGWGNVTLYGTADGADRENEVARDRRVVQRAVDALPEISAADGPWFLFIGPTGPHDPFVVPEPYASMYNPTEVPLPPNYHDDLRDKPNIYRRAREQFWDQLTEGEVREAVAHYWGYCTMLDDLLADVLRAVDATGQADDTLVLFTSDHGEYAGAHGLFCKGVPAFEEAYRIPFVMRWPRRTRAAASAGHAVEDIVTLADMAPTLLDAAGIDHDADRFTGRSLLSFVDSEIPVDWPDTFFSQFNGVELYYSQRVVRTATHKYVYNGFDFDELYDLVADPHELRNVAADPAYVHVVRDLVTRMWRFARAQGDDHIINPYLTVAFAPYGPMEAFAEGALRGRT